MGVPIISVTFSGCARVVMKLRLDGRVEIPRGDGKKIGEPRPIRKTTNLGEYVPKKLKSRVTAYDETKMTMDETRMARRPGSQNKNK